MTVAELITALQALPQDLPVYLTDWNEQYADPTELRPRDIAVRDRRMVTWEELPKRVELGDGGF